MYVETRSLTKRYGHFVALDQFSFSVARGEVVGLLGPNGAGKTTLLRLLMGYLRPSEGSATIDGLDCYRQTLEVHRRVSYLPGEARLFRTMKAREVIDFFTGVRRDGSRPRAEQLASERFGLDLTRPVASFSTGMRQKLALAVTLAVDTPLVILDEPTSNLDPTVRSRRGGAGGRGEASRTDGDLFVARHFRSRAGLRPGADLAARTARAHADDCRAAPQAPHSAQLTGPLPAVPESFNGHVTVAGGQTASCRSKHRASCRACWAGWPRCRWPK